MFQKPKRYEVMSETLNCEEGPYRAYGIVAGSCAIHDISTDRAVVEDMVNLFNRMAVDPHRVREIIESMLP